MKGLPGCAVTFGALLCAACGGSVAVDAGPRFDVSFPPVDSAAADSAAAEDSASLPPDGTALSEAAVPSDQALSLDQTTSSDQAPFDGAAPSASDLASAPDLMTSADLAPQLPPGTNFFVSPAGSDSWSGTLPAPNAGGTDGPFATLATAQNAIRTLKTKGTLNGPVFVYLREGRYFLGAPLTLTPEDGGSATTPLTWAAYPGEKPIVSGGRAITGWKMQNGRFTTNLPDVAAGKWYFGALWVNGTRKTRARSPNSDYYFSKGVVTGQEKSGFYFNAGDLKPFTNPGDELIVVFDSWSTELHRIAHLDMTNNLVTFTTPGNWPFNSWGAARYYVENVPEALDAPGEWYLDRKSGDLNYIPQSGEDLSAADVVAPVLTQLILLQGDPATGKFIDYLTFQGIKLQHTDFPIGAAGYNDNQAGYDAPAALGATGARHLTVAGGELSHLGGYGAALAAGSTDGLITRTHFFDLGAGGVKLGTPGDAASPALVSGHNTVDNNFIHDGGHVIAAGVGVWIGRSSDNKVTRNEIADLDYTGVSVGWSWGYAASSAGNNLVEGNHLHHLMRNRLSDGAGVYTLGISPGTVVRGNHIHDISSYNPSPGGWGLYADEGSSNILWERNLVYSTRDGAVHQHYGENNLFRYNVFAYSQGPQLVRTREETHLSFTFQSNILYYNNGTLLGSNWTNNQYAFDYNVYWDESAPGSVDWNCLSLAQWQALGMDVHSIIADPLFVDPHHYDFRLQPGSPALKQGFLPIDLTQVGLYGDPQWVALPSTVARTPTPLPTSTGGISDDFESTSIGSAPQGVAYAYAGGKGASILVSGDTAASGAHSLKVTDAAGLPNVFEPHFYYAPQLRGPLIGTFKLNMSPSQEVFYHEWRYWPAGNYVAGPSLSVDGSGQVAVAGKVLTKVPTGSWVTYKITTTVGLSTSGKWDLEVDVPNQAPQKFTNLAGGPLCRVTWYGFVANADVAAVYYLDDISLKTP